MQAAALFAAIEKAATQGDRDPGAVPGDVLEAFLEHCSEHRALCGKRLFLLGIAKVIHREGRIFSRNFGPNLRRALFYPLNQGLLESFDRLRCVDFQPMLPPTPDAARWVRESRFQPLTGREFLHEAVARSGSRIYLPSSCPHGHSLPTGLDDRSCTGRNGSI
jgi:hypothetical protein